jgi:hypothetical protein
MFPQATVGLLVAKTLTNATANPFLSGGSGAYNPVLALDVFLVQVLGVLCSVWRKLYTQDVAEDHLGGHGRSCLVILQIRRRQLECSLT